MSLPEGSVFAGRYRVVRAIAAGGMGAVYEVVHIETEAVRALKVMRPEIVGKPDLERRFRQEAKVAAKIDSEFVVEVFDAGIDDATRMPFLVMEFLRGEELAERIKRTGAMSPDQALAFLGQIAGALDKSHAANVVHRDLKPENIFVTTRDNGDPHIKVLDFGIAKIIEGTQHGKPTRNLGTPLFMAPEQFKVGAPIKPHTDVFAFGMLAYALLVGDSYWFDEASAEKNVFKFVATAMKGPQESAVARAKRRGIELPAAFQPWFARVTAHDGAQRFASAGEAFASLEQVFAATSSMAAPASSAVGTVAAGTAAAGTAAPTSAGGLPVSSAHAPTPSTSIAMAQTAPVSSLAGGAHAGTQEAAMPLQQTGPAVVSTQGAPYPLATAAVAARTAPGSLPAMQPATQPATTEAAPPGPPTAPVPAAVVATTQPAVPPSAAVPLPTAAAPSGGQGGPQAAGAQSVGGQSLGAEAVGAHAVGGQPVGAQPFAQPAVVSASGNGKWYALIAALAVAIAVVVVIALKAGPGEPAADRNDRKDRDRATATAKSTTADSDGEGVGGSTAAVAKAEQAASSGATSPGLAADAPSDDTGDASLEDPGGDPGDDPGGDPNGQPGDDPGGDPNGQPGDDPGGDPSGQPGGPDDPPPDGPASGPPPAPPTGPGGGPKHPPPRDPPPGSGPGSGFGPGKPPFKGKKKGGLGPKKGKNGKAKKPFGP